MIRIYGQQQIGVLHQMVIGGRCPHCTERSKFSLATTPNFHVLSTHQAREFVASYVCEGCSRVIPVQWLIANWQGEMPVVTSPESILRVVEEFELEHVPPAVGAEINEALDCLSVNAHNGFAAVVRRTIQTISTDLGAQGSTKIQNQINDAYSQGMVDEDQKIVFEQIMLTGHDGAHPHLPEVDKNRAALLLDLLRDIVFQIYTRPARIKKNSELRKEAI